MRVDTQTQVPLTPWLGCVKFPRYPKRHKFERPAFKDTVKSLPGEVTRLLMKFDPPTGTHVHHGDKFRYVFHCHILEHEENEMMRPYDV